MSIISSRTKVFKSPQPVSGNIRVIDYFTSHLFVETQGNMLEVPGSDGFDGEGAAHVARRLAYYPIAEEALANQEQHGYISMLEQGLDAFAETPDHQTDAQAFSEVVKFFIQLDIITLASYHKAIPFLSNLTNPQITSYGLSWIEFSNWMSDADTLKVSINNYVPMVVS